MYLKLQGRQYHPSSRFLLPTSDLMRVFSSNHFIHAAVWKIEPSSYLSLHTIRHSQITITKLNEFLLWGPQPSMYGTHRPIVSASCISLRQTVTD